MNDPAKLHEAIIGALSEVIDPETGVNVVRMRLIEDLEASELIVYRPIGYVENEYELSALPERIRDAESRIVLDPSLVDGLQGLEAGQQVMIVFHFHRSDGYELTQHPQGDCDRPQRGVFALRSPRRPNPIGITVVELMDMKGNVLRVRGLDAINGTPVLDVKPA